MVSFQTKKIDGNTHVGDFLKDARVKNYGNLEVISKVLNINIKYLEALENSYYWLLLDPAYTKNYLKKYAEYLSLDFENLYGLFYKEWDVYQKTSARKKMLAKLREWDGNWLNALVVPKIIKYIVIVFLIFVGGLYLWVEVRSIFVPPFLELTSPGDNFVTEDQVASVAGRAAKESRVTINGKLVVLNNDGYFKEDVPLQGGMNILKVSASKKYSRENLITRNIMVVDSRTSVIESR